jgi:hypothetical protein
VHRYFAKWRSKLLLFAVLGAKLEIDPGGKGEVYLKSPSEFSFERLRGLTDLKYRDTIFVGSKTSVTLDFDDPRIPSVRIHENSIVVFSQSEVPGKNEFELKVSKGAATIVPRRRIRQQYREKAKVQEDSSKGPEKEIEILKIEEQIEKTFREEEKAGKDLPPPPKVVITAIDDEAARTEMERKENTEVLAEAATGTVYRVVKDEELLVLPPPSENPTNPAPLAEILSVRSSSRPLEQIPTPGGPEPLDTPREITPEDIILENAGILPPAPPPPAVIPPPVVAPPVEPVVPVPPVAETPPTKPGKAGTTTAASPTSNGKKQRSESGKTKRPETVRIAPPKELPPLPPPPVQTSGLWTVYTSVGSFLSLIDQKGSIGALASYALPLDMALGARYTRRRWSTRVGLTDYLANYPDDAGYSVFRQHFGASVDFFWYEVGLELNYFNRAWVEDTTFFNWYTFPGVSAKIMWKRNFLFRQLSQGGGGIWLLDWTMGINLPVWSKVSTATAFGWGIEGGLQGWAPKFSMFGDKIHARFGPAVYLSYLQLKSGSRYSASHSDAKITMSMRFDF